MLENFVNKVDGLFILLYPTIAGCQIMRNFIFFDVNPWVTCILIDLDMTENAGTNPGDVIHNGLVG